MLARVLYRDPLERAGSEVVPKIVRLELRCSQDLGHAAATDVVAGMYGHDRGAPVGFCR